MAFGLWAPRNKCGVLTRCACYGLLVCCLAVPLPLVDWSVGRLANADGNMRMSCFARDEHFSTHDGNGHHIPLPQKVVCQSINDLY